MSRIEDIVKGMHKSYLSEIPKCNFCQNPATVDGPTLSGQWAYMCNNCVIDKADIVAVQYFGTQLILRQTDVKPPVAGVLVAEECSSFASVLMDETNREIKCPNCKEVRTIESDFVGFITCHGCQSKLRVMEFLP